MATDDADLLWTTRNAFYVGAHAAAIAEAADLEGLGPAACVERDTYVMRCYVELGSYEVRERRREGGRNRARASKDKNARAWARASARVASDRHPLSGLIVFWRSLGRENSR